MRRGSRCDARAPLRLRPLGELVATTCEFAYEAEYADAPTISVRLRQTAIWERSGGSWRMLHEHLSAPADADESGRD